MQIFFYGHDILFIAGSWGFLVAPVKYAKKVSLLARFKQVIVNKPDIM